MKTVCPKCMVDATIMVALCDGERIDCPECGESYTLAEVRAVVESWGPLLSWLDSHPAKK